MNRFSYWQSCQTYKWECFYLVKNELTIFYDMLLGKVENAGWKILSQQDNLQHSQGSSHTRQQGPNHGSLHSSFVKTTYNTHSYAIILIWETLLFLRIIVLQEVIFTFKSYMHQGVLVLYSQAQNSALFHSGFLISMC